MHLFYFVLGLCVMYALIKIKNKCWIKNNSKKLLDQIIQKLVRQCSRWMVASEQDESPLIYTLHANYGTGYLWALKDIASNNEIKSATGINPQRFEKEITSAQDKATKKLIQACPAFAPNPSYLTNISGQ